MLEQEVVSERDLRSKSDRTKDDVERDLVDALEQLRIANLNNASKDKDLTVSKHLIFSLMCKMNVGDRCWRRNVLVTILKWC